jgi:hypothetical protein
LNFFFITERAGLLPAPRFTQALRSRWPHATVKEVRDPADIHVLEFSIPMAHFRVDGSLNREGDSVVFIGDIRDCAEFALWCHGQIPPGEPATFCDEGMSGSIELNIDTTRADILRAFRYQPLPE